MSYFGRWFRWLPSPMKRLREHLHIEKEWQQFKHHLRPHQFKIYLGFVLVTYPLYAPYAIDIKNWLSYQVAYRVNGLLGADRAPFQITDNFAKNLVGSVFQDENIKQEGVQFVNSIIQEQIFVRNVLTLLLSALKSSDFMQWQALNVSSKELTVKLFQDKEVQQAIRNSLASVAQSEEVKDALAKLVQSAFSSEESTRTIVQLLKKGISNQQVKEALSGTVNYAVQELLKDEETLSQLKIFIFFLLRKFENDEEIKSMMDILFAKGLGVTKKKKESDLQKLLREMDKNGRQNADN